MKTKNFIIFGLLALLINPPVSAGPYIAYSLREAAQRAQTGDTSRALTELGGMTRILGMVQDPVGDIILVGRVVEGHPVATLDDLTVALRARLVLGEWPTVSIDPTRETAKTGLQKTRFLGGIANTAFGEDFLNADIFLKTYSLQKSPSASGIKSYRYYVERDITHALESQGVGAKPMRWVHTTAQDETLKRLQSRAVQQGKTYQTRFWFTPVDPHVVARDGVFFIREQRLMVREEKLGKNLDSQGESARDPAAERFARRFTEHLQGVSHIKELARLKILFDLVTVAEGIRSIEKRPNLDYLVNRKPIASHSTRSDYELIRLLGYLDRTDGLTQVISISGGLRFETEIRWLNEGDVSPLRSIVLGTRPQADALTWSLPLDGWNMPNSHDLQVVTEKDNQTGQVPVDAGFTLSTQTALLQPANVAPSRWTPAFSGFSDPKPAPAFRVTPRMSQPGPLGGVLMKLEVHNDSFTQDDTLDALRDSVLQHRPKGNRLFWTLD